MRRFYPALLYWRPPRSGPKWLVSMVDFEVWDVGDTQVKAMAATREQLQDRVNAMNDQEQTEMPYPSHQLVVEHKLVMDEAHGWALIGIETRMESDLDLDQLPKKEKSNDSKRKGKKTIGRPRR